MFLTSGTGILNLIVTGPGWPTPQDIRIWRIPRNWKKKMDLALGITWFTWVEIGTTNFAMRAVFCRRATYSQRSKKLIRKKRKNGEILTINWPTSNGPLSTSILSTRLQSRRILCKLFKTNCTLATESTWPYPNSKLKQMHLIKLS